MFRKSDGTNRFEEAMNFSIFNKRGEKFPTAEIYAIDFRSDYKASVYLLLGGYYRQAVLSEKLVGGSID